MRLSTFHRAAGSVLVLALIGGPLATAAAVEPSVRHPLWVARGQRGGIAYLLGSLHALTPGHYPLAEPIERAFQASGTLVAEIDLGEMAQPQALAALASRGVLEAGRTLDTVLDPALFERLAAHGDAAGVPRAVLVRAKPWLASLLLLEPTLRAAGFQAAHGVDRHFYERARAAGMPIEPLETAAYQIERLDGLPLAVQVEMLEAALDDAARQQEQAHEIAAAWARGDAAALERLLLDVLRRVPTVYERVILERHRAWMPKILSCLERSAPCFIVVGAAHLVGPDGLVAMLRARGHPVEQQ